MRRVLAIAMVLAFLPFSACGQAAPTPPPETVGEARSVISVSGKVVPAVWATLSAQTGGVVLEVRVVPGDQVKEGDLLVQLDPADAQLAVQQAEAALAAAQARLDALKAGPRPEELEEARAAVAAAQAALQKLLQPDPVQVAVARAELAQAEVNLRRAQEAYDRVKWDPAIGIRPEALQLEQATGAYNIARARLDALLNPAAADVAAARAQLQQAKARLARLEAGPRPEEIAMAEAEVIRARAALEAARLTLSRCEIRAPFAGTIGRVHVRAGELVVPGQPLVTLGDLNTLQVETTDLDEVDVVRAQVGQKVTVTFDAVPGRVFNGKIVRIYPMAEPGAGGVRYTAIIALEEIDPALRWGMTAFVDIEE